jgi:hypothetical protein
MADFSFIFNDDIRKIVERDYKELQPIDPRTSTKSVIVLSGGIIEGLLLDALVESEKWTFEKACQQSLRDMIGPAKGKGIITEDRLTDVTRRYRNLIHPAREIREKIVFEENDAILAKAAVDIIAREVRTWADSERNRKQWRDFLTGLNHDQIELLKWFASPAPPDSEQFEHPRLSHSVYRSTESLIANGVLTKEIVGRSEHGKERISLVPEAVPLIEELVIKGELQRQSLILDHGNIAASGASGSGAPAYTNSTTRRRPKFPAFIEVNKNQAVVEESTGITVTLHDVPESRNASLTITLPGKDPQRYPETVVGHVWKFDRGSKSYRMTLLEVSHIKGRAKLRIDPNAA